MSRYRDREKRSKRKIWFHVFRAAILDMKEEFPRIYKYASRVVIEWAQQGAIDAMLSLRKDSHDWQDAAASLTYPTRDQRWSGIQLNEES